MPRRKAPKESRPIPACELGVLHAFGPGYLHAPNRMLEFKTSKAAGDKRLRVPLRELRLVCVYGAVRVTAGAIRLITDAGAALAYLSASGIKTNGVLVPSADAWKGRRYRQFQSVQDRPWVFNQSRRLVVEKLETFERALSYFRQQGRLDKQSAAVLHGMPEVRQSAAAATDLSTLLGLEGIATKRWFRAFDSLLPDGWTFPGRRKRPPTDPVNAMLSLGYTLLFHRVQAACMAWGLDSALGFFHQYRPGRASLACDLMEPFRVPGVDRLVLQTLGRGSYTEGDFVHNDADNSVRMSEDAFKRWLGHLEEHFHAGDEGKPSLQVSVMNRVGAFVESLPPWNGAFPGVGVVGELPEALDAYTPADSAGESAEFPNDDAETEP